MPRIIPGAQPTIKSLLQNKKKIVKRCDLAVAKWMINSSVPFNAINSKYNQPMIDAIASMGPSYKAPNFHSIHGYLLTKNVDEVKSMLKAFLPYGRKPTAQSWLMDG